MLFIIAISVNLISFNNLNKDASIGIVSNSSNVYANDIGNNNLTNSTTETEPLVLNYHCYADSSYPYMSEQQAWELVGKCFWNLIFNPSWESCSCFILSIIALFAVTAGRHNNKPR